MEQEQNRIEYNRKRWKIESIPNSWSWKQTKKVEID